jgi:excisionase family DNA binding protein
MEQIILSPVKLCELESMIENSMRKVLEQNLPFEKKGNNVPYSDLLNIQEASKFLGLAVPTLYAKVSDRLIPHSKIGKKLFFSRDELSTWVRSGKRSSVNELKQRAKDF